MHVFHHKTTKQVCRFDTDEAAAKFKAEIEGPEDWVDGEPPEVSDEPEAPAEEHPE